MSPERVFQVLTFAALLAGAWLYGDYWKKVGAADGGGEAAASLREVNAKLTLEIDELKSELANVRSMLSKGPFPIPEDLIAYVEKDLGMVFLNAPSAKRASPDALRTAAEKNINLVRGRNKLVLENISWELLGLIPSDQNLLGQLIAIETQGARGLFDLTTGEILLSEDYDPQSIPDSAILVRLLTQQLTFQYHPRKEWKTRDEWQAWQATFFGAAESTRQRYQRSRSVSEQGVIWKDPEQTRSDLLLTLSPSMQGFSNFPYLDGQDYAGFHYIDTREAYLKMFREPAATTAAVIHPKRPAIDPVEISFEEPESILLGRDNLGELGLRIWLEPYIGTDPASKLAANWRGDQYQLLDEKETPILTWQIEMATIESADELVEQVRKFRIPPMKETQAGRTFTITSLGTRVTFTNSPQPA